MVHSFHSTLTPRWLAFIVDLAIVAFVSLIIFLLPEYYFAPMDSAYRISYLVTILCYVAMNFLVGNYRCIVRFSMTEDLFKAMKYVAAAASLSLIISCAFALISPEHCMLIDIVPVVVIAGMTLCLEMLAHITVKYTYSLISNYIKHRKPVIVLGADFNSIALANQLKAEANGDFRPVALLTFSDQNPIKNVNDLKVERFDPDTIAELFQSYKCDTLIFLQSHLEMLRKGFADSFIKNHIHLCTLNQVNEFNASETDREKPDISSRVRSVKIEDLLGRPVIKNHNPHIREAISRNVVLVTGAAGSIGSEIVRQVATVGASEIVLLDQAETPMHEMQLEMQKNFPDSKITLFIADVQNRARLEQAFKRFRPRFVYHAAAYKHVPMMEANPSEAILTNVKGTKNLADLSLQYGVQKFVMISTDKAVNPTNIMGASKRLAEIYVQSLFFNALERRGEDNCTQFITTRFGNVLGSNGSVIPLFRKQIKEGGPVTVTHRDIIRYFMTIQEACALVLEAGCMGHGGEIFLFDMGKPVKIYDLAYRMILLSGLRPNQDIQIVETGLRPGEKLYEELLNDKETTLPTNNEKIMIAKVRRYDFSEVEKKYATLIRLAEDGEIHDMVLNMKEIVPEYVSNNSVFQEIDRELNHKSDSGSTTPPRCS